jgi:peroxiredoxin
MLKLNDTLPAATLYEYNEIEGEGCPIGPAAVDVVAAAKGKTVAMFALPGAFTPTCSAKHLPGYLAAMGDLQAAGVDEVWCVSVNDAFVMHAWGVQSQVAGRVRMLGDGAAAFTKAVGLELDLSARGMGVRSQRYSALLVDGVVKALHIEAPGQFAVSDAATMLAAANANRAV